MSLIAREEAHGNSTDAELASQQDDLQAKPLTNRSKHSSAGSAKVANIELVEGLSLSVRSA
jgi:hypothetical protein